MFRVVALIAGIGSSLAFACPTCSCGNPTITTMGLDQPFTNRFRVGLSSRAWETTEPQGPYAQRVRELRFDLSLSFAPTAWLQLFATVPAQFRELQSPSLEKQRAAGPGEIDLAGRVVVARDERMRARYLVSLTAGLTLPSAPTVSDRGGTQLDVDAQLALGAWTPHLGLSNVSFLSEKWAVFATATLEVPLGGRLGVRSGPSARGLLGAQWQPIQWLAARAGLEGRFDSPRSINKVVDVSGAGPSLFAAPDVLFYFANRWVVQAGVRLPVASSLGNGLRPGPVFALAAVVDV